MDRGVGRHLPCLCGCAGRGAAAGTPTAVTALPPSALQWTYIATNRFLGEDYEGCIHAARNAGDLNVTSLGFQAAAYGLLGDAASAQASVDRFQSAVRARWFGTCAASENAMSRWFLHLFPIREEQDWERLRTGFIKAGAPEIDFHHGEWWGLEPA